MLDPISTIKKGLDTVGDVAETVAKPVGGAAGEAVAAGAHIVDGTSNTVVFAEKAVLDQFNVAATPVTGLVGTLEDKVKALLKNPFTDVSKFLGDLGGKDEIVGGSVEAILMQIAARDRARLTHKVFELKNLQAPGEGATEQQVNDYNTQKTALMADIQSLQEEVQQTTTAATNISKSDNDTNMAIDRNI